MWTLHLALAIDGLIVAFEGGGDVGTYLLTYFLPCC